MTIELEALVSKFQAHRNKKPGKKVNYPQRLAKAVAHLDNNLSPKSIAKGLGIFDSSVIAWRRKYSPSSAHVSSFIPVAVETFGANADVTHVKLVFVESSVPTSSLATDYPRDLFKLRERIMLNPSRGCSIYISKSPT